MDDVMFESACLPDIIRSTMEVHPDLVEYYNREGSDKDWYFYNALNSLMKPGEELNDTEAIHRLLKAMAYFTDMAQGWAEHECFDYDVTEPWFDSAKDLVQNEYGKYA